MATRNLTIQELWEEAGFQPNENQKKTILYTDGPLFLPAGPGAGKTRVLLWRVSPDEIYLSTFTEKAAHQLVEGI